MELKEDDRASLPSASGRARVSSLLHPLTNTLLAAAPGILTLLCVDTKHSLVLLWLPGVNYGWEIAIPSLAEGIRNQHRASGDWKWS